MFSQNCWSKAEFPNTFQFEKESDGFSKIVSGNRLLFRPVTLADDLHQVVDVQKKAWGWSERDLAPVHILALFQDTNGGVFAAFDKRNEILGFAAGMGGGVDSLTQEPMVISSMLAIADSSKRHMGIGRELKIIQAFYAYQNGYKSMKWLYDPERGPNASLNFNLGAMAEEWWVDKYGRMESELYGPVPTDRLRAVWRYADNRVSERLLQISSAPNFESLENVPIATAESLVDNDRVLVEISTNIDEEPDKIKILRRRQLRIVMNHYMEKQNYIASEFIKKVEHDDGTFQNFYLLEARENAYKRRLSIRGI